MRDLTNIKKKYESMIAKKYCNIDHISFCNKDICTCDKTAEVMAYIEGVLPEEFINCTINDFKGKDKDKKTLLDIKSASYAKKQIIKYCWELKIEEFKKFSFNSCKLDEFSVIQKRRDRGDNVIIYGPSFPPLGKTLIASIIMKEAIKQKIKPGGYLETYEWVEFNLLKDCITKDSYDLSDYRNCDWLVVDNIKEPIYASLEQKAYIVEKIEPFFAYRLIKKLPTILIFRFNIRLESVIKRMEDILGISIFNLIKAKNTLHISLEKIVKENVEE